MAVSMAAFTTNDSITKVVSSEMNFGQVFLEMERCIGGRCPAHLVGHAGGTVHKPHEILETIKEAAK